MALAGKYASWLVLAAILALAVLLRLGGLSQPYHQDEYKWAAAANPNDGFDSPIPHPPLALFLYTHAGAAITYDHLRVLPAAASLITIAVMFWYMRRRFGLSAAAISGLVLAAAPYALLGSLQIDIDGAFLPLAAMLSFAGYTLWRESGRAGLPLLAAGLLLGFGFKLSFILVPAALCLDLLLSRPDLIKPFLRRNVVIGGGIALAIAAAALAVVWQHVWFLRYVDNFVALGGRDYFQLLFQTVKAVIYLSPLPLAALLLAWPLRRQLREWYLFLAVNALFYFVVFDFSHRTFDRYLLFVVLPCAVMCGAALGRYVSAKALGWGTAAAVSAAAGWAVFSLPHALYPLIPKTQFIHAAATFHWSFLLPMTGGSGPAGFYLPVDALAVWWGASALALGSWIVASAPRRAAAAFVLAGISIVYAGFVDAEYLRGAFYGSTSQVVRALIDPLDAAKVPGGVLTYNDIGAYELIEKGIYAARFYPHPEFVAGNVEKFREHPGYYLVVEMPELNPASGYEAFFARCAVKDEAKSGRIKGYLYDCRGVDAGIVGGV